MEKMNLYDRAKIFLPFDALKGFREALKKQEKIKVDKKLHKKVLIILSSAFFALTLLFVFLGIRNWRKLEKTDLDKEVRTGKIEQLIEE